LLPGAKVPPCGTWGGDYTGTLLTAAQRDRFLVVLVSPRNPLNIGAAARAMANFGFARLAVVSPYAPHWREARSAVGAPRILQSAIECATLTEAVADCSLVLGTASVAHRTPQQPVVPLPALSPRLRTEIEHGGRIALVFGPEKRGLTSDDLSHCHLLVEIPTAPQQPSMNLGQAVAVCLYEIAVRAFSSTQPASALTESVPQAFSPDHEAASSATLELLAGLVDETMDAAHYSPPEMRSANRHDARLLLRRLSLTQRDARRTLGLFRRILWRLRHGPSSHPE
jgi:TrmH family RNA methyltransferase